MYLGHKLRCFVAKTAGPGDDLCLRTEIASLLLATGCSTASLEPSQAAFGNQCDETRPHTKPWDSVFVILPSTGSRLLPISMFFRSKIMLIFDAFEKS